MFCHVFVSIALICAIPSTYSYSAGGAALSPACDDMTPQHHVEPQSSPVPYKLNLSTNKLSAGKDEPVHLKIQGKSAGDTIKGFMIQARIGNKPVGKFIVKSKKHAQLLSCSGGSDNAVTHKKIFGNGPNVIEVDWIAPPGITGDVKFYATVALNGGIFWVNQLIEQVNIS